MVAPPIQPFLSSFPFGNCSVLGALSDTKFVVIDYTLGLFILYEIVGGAVVEADSVAHSYPQIPNQFGAPGEVAPYAARWAQTAGNTQAVLYLGYQASEVTAFWSLITLDGGGMLSVTTSGTYGWGWDTDDIRRVVASANGSATWAWEMGDGSVVYNAPNSGVVDGMEVASVGAFGMLVAYTDGPGPRCVVTAAGSGTWPPTVTLTCGSATLTFTHPTGSRTHDAGGGDIRYESTLQYLPLGDNGTFCRVAIIGTVSGSPVLTYRVFRFVSNSLSWETGWMNVILPDGFAADEYPRAATYDGTVMAVAYVRDFWG